MNKIKSFFFVLVVVFGLALSYSSTSQASGYNNTFTYRVNNTVYECNFGGYTGKIVAVLNNNDFIPEFSTNYLNFRANDTYFTFYYLKDANTVSTIKPTVLRQYTVEDDNTLTLVNDYVSSGESVALSFSVGYGYYRNVGTLYPDFNGSGIEILKVNLRNIKPIYNDNGVFTGYSSTTHNLNSNLLSYFKTGTFCDVGDNYVFKVYSSVKNLTPNYNNPYGGETIPQANASFTLNNVQVDAETGVVTWDGFTYDSDAIIKGVYAIIPCSPLYPYDKVFDVSAEVDVNYGDLHFYDSTNGVWSRKYPGGLILQPYYVDKYGQFYVGVGTRVTLSNTLAYSDVAGKVFATGKRKETVGVAPSKGDIDTDLADQYANGIIIAIDDLEYSNLSKDFTFCEPYATYESGSFYLDDLYLTSFNADTKINAVWTGIKYPELLQKYFNASSQGQKLNYARVIIKCEYSAKRNPDLVAFSAYAPVYIDVNDKRVSIDVDKLQPTSDLYYLSRVYFTPFVSTTVYSSMGTSINPSTALYYGRSSVVSFDVSDSSNDKVILDYGDILTGSHNSVYDGTGYDDEYYYENQEFYDKVVDTGDVIVEGVVNVGTGGLNIDGFWSTLTSLASSLGSFPQFIGNMFSFLPSWIVLALGSIIGVVIVLRFLGR